MKPLPDFFKPILWSYDFGAVDAERDKKTIIINAINYGDLKHWRWIISSYGKEEVKNILTSIPATEMRERVRPLVALVFDINDFNYASRGIG